MADALTRLLADVGILRGDGTAAGPPPEEEVPVAVEAQSSGEPANIWTPDSEQPAGLARRVGIRANWPPSNAPGKPGG